MSDARKYFPADSFRKHQQKVMKLVLGKLQEPEIDNVIIVAPTGFGKSAVNVGACRAFDDAFYVTPQKQLRQQLVNDDITGPHVNPLKARTDYICSASGKDCNNCPVRRDEEKSCLTTPGCTYWEAKEDAMDAQTAALTFAYLVVDNHLPEEMENHGQISFEDREVLVVDEAHNLEQDTASMFAGFTISPHSLPIGIFKDYVPQNIKGESFKFGQLENQMTELKNALADYVRQNSEWGDPNPTPEVEQCRKLMEKLRYAIESHNDGKEWVINKDDTEYRKQIWDTFEVKPVNVAPFLQRNIWSRADKRIISTATAPYRDSISRWCYRIGLDPDRTFALFVPMEFPVENRPIHTKTMVDEMTGDTFEERLDDVMDTMADIAAHHSGEKGLVHTSSYERSELIMQEAMHYDTLDGNVMIQHRDSDKEKLLEDWADNDKQILLSPSMEEGVDLVDDQCRFQILAKVPYPSPGDARVDAILDKSHGWDWYYETTGLKICQSYGRAVRHEEDYADYYVLDESFNKVRKKIEFPEWVEEAIQ